MVDPLVNLDPDRQSRAGDAMKQFQRSGYLSLSLEAGELLDMFHERVRITPY